MPNKILLLFLFFNWNSAFAEKSNYFYVIDDKDNVAIVAEKQPENSRFTSVYYLDGSGPFLAPSSKLFYETLQKGDFVRNKEGKIGIVSRVFKNNKARVLFHKETEHVIIPISNLVRDKSI